MCKMALVRAASTDPLAVVEAQLGSVDSWPPHVLRFMFILKPYPRVVKQVAAFMYGNYVRLSDAVGCDNACNGRYRKGVETEMRACYDEWDIQVNRRHMERYYSMLLKCLAWINGKALEQYEAVKPVVKFSLLGPTATD
jgi:hypothetical protein